MRISDWSSDVCSSDLPDRPTAPLRMGNHYPECGACQPVRQAADAPKLHTPSRACTSWEQREHKAAALRKIAFLAISEAHQVFHWLPAALCLARDFGVEVSVLSPRSEEHTPELQSLMR